MRTTTVRRGLLALTTTGGCFLLAVLGSGPATAADDGMGGTATGRSGIPLWVPVLVVAGWLVVGWYLMRRNRPR